MYNYRAYSYCSSCRTVGSEDWLKIIFEGWVDGEYVGIQLCPDCLELFNKSIRRNHYDSRRICQ